MTVNPCPTPLSHTKPECGLTQIMKRPGKVQEPFIVSNGQGKVREFGKFMYSIAFFVIK